VNSITLTVEQVVSSALFCEVFHLGSRTITNVEQPESKLLSSALKTDIPHHAERGTF